MISRIKNLDILLIIPLCDHAYPVFSYILLAFRGYESGLIVDLL